MEPDTQSIFVDHLIKIYSHEDYLLNDHKIINNKIDIPVLTEDEYQNIVKLTSIININDDIKLYFNNEKLYSFYIMQHIKKYNMLKKYEIYLLLYILLILLNDSNILNFNVDIPLIIIIFKR